MRPPSRSAEFSRAVFLLVGLWFVAYPLGSWAQGVTIDPISDVRLAPGATVDVPIHATDIEGQPLLFGINFGPAFATVTTTGPASGVVHIATTPSDEGTWVIEIWASDEIVGRTDLEDFTLTLEPVAGAPLAYPGGPYLGATGFPVEFNATASYDAEGDPLTYLWDFGDGVTGLGVTPFHEYHLNGHYPVSLVVTDPSGLTGTGHTYAIIGGWFPMNAFITPNAQVRLAAENPVWIHLEAVPWLDLLETIRPDDITMSYGSEVAHAALAKNLILGDADHDGLRDMKVSFEKSDLRRLFADLGDGWSPVTVLVTAGMVNPGRLVARQLGFQVLKGGSETVAQIAPNPLAGQGAVFFSTQIAGPVRIEIFDVQGRRAARGPDHWVSAGSHEIALPRVRDDGTPLARGVYFFRLHSPDGDANGKFVIAR